MEEIAFCTIITASYIHYAMSLYESLSRHGKIENFNILIADERTDFQSLESEFPNVKIWYPEDMHHVSYCQEVQAKYQASNIDCFRWTMKSVFLRFLIERGYRQVFFLDPDLYFFGSHTFLSRELEGSSVVLTPHWRASDPHIDAANFATLQTSGLFNAGFVGITTSGVAAIEWWTKVCLNECVKAPERSIFDDQAYLNLIPIYFEDVKVIRHRGCNVANWNQIECSRVADEKGVVRINGETEIVFIHFTKSTINGILSGKDGLLAPYLKQHQDSLRKFSAWIPKQSEESSNLPSPKKADGEAKSSLQKGFTRNFKRVASKMRRLFSHESKS